MVFTSLFSMTCSAYFLIESTTICPGVSPLAMDWTLLLQSLIRQHFTNSQFYGIIFLIPVPSCQIIIVVSVDMKVKIIVALNSWLFSCLSFLSPRIKGICQYSHFHELKENLKMLECDWGSKVPHAIMRAWVQILISHSKIREGEVHMPVALKLWRWE